MTSATVQVKELPLNNALPPSPANSSPAKAAPRSLRFRLFLLAASGLVPLALVLLLSTAYIARERQAGAQRAALELSRALATAVDSELISTVALLQNLAIAADLHLLEPAALHGERFTALSRRIVEQQGWRTLVVADAAGDVVMRAVDTGNRSPSPIERASMLQTLESRRPVVGRVSQGPTGQNAYAVRIPVLREGRVQYVVSAVVPTSRILSVIDRQQLASAWVVTVLDQDGNRVARSPPNSATRHSPSLGALMASRGQEGMGVTRTLEGVESHTGFTRVRDARWVVAVGIPAREIDAELYRLLAAVGAGTAASLALLAWLAWRMARSISGPIDGLKQAAAALGAGQQVALPSLGVQELDEVGRALRRAASDRDDANGRRSKVEAEREQLLGQLEDALRVAEQANRNKDEFLALLGHELRNPLAPITNAVHLMELKGDGGTARERAIIRRQLQYVTRLVDDLLDASRITTRRLVIKLRPLQPVAVIEQTVESLKGTLGQRRLAFDVEPQARLLWVQADEARLVQVFSNLLGNAIKFTQPTGTIAIAVAARAGRVQFTIRDDGAGMRPMDLERAFELFYQAPNSARAVNGGLGLGLAIVKSLVEMHSGSVSAHSDGPDTGTTVTVTLPVAEPPADRVAAAPQPEAGAVSPRVLIVDDNVDAADTLAALLELSGFQVQVTYTPQAALEVFDIFAPAAAVLDIGLPGMDGYELARRLRSGPFHFGGPLVALTGYGQQQDIQKALDAGFDAHQTKPVAPDALLEVLARLLADRPRG